MAKPSEVIVAINGLVSECDELLARIDAKDLMAAWHFCVVVNRVPIEGGTWLPAGVVCGPKLPRSVASSTWLGEIAPPLFEVVESPVVRDTVSYLATLTFDIGIEQVEDIFNDKVAYTCKTFADVRRITAGMRPIIAKFELFGDSANVLPILGKFRANYERMKAALEDALARIQDVPSPCAAVRAKLEAANEALRAAAAIGATFFRKDAARQALGTCSCGLMQYSGDKLCRGCARPVHAPPPPPRADAARPNPFAATLGGFAPSGPPKPRLND